MLRHRRIKQKKRGKMWTFENIKTNTGIREAPRKN